MDSNVETSCFHVSFYAKTVEARMQMRLSRQVQGLLSYEARALNLVIGLRMATINLT